MGFFIPNDNLPNLKLYKYSSEDHSVISQKILKKWWNNFVTIFPMTMAPNVITLLGLMFIVANLLCVFYYDPYLNEESPRWCYFFYAFGLFMYQTFDGCDGCHARNTGQSGPLGELFDHSIDAINTTLGSIIFSSVLQFGYGKLFLISQFASVANFYLSTWEEYHTHTLFLSAFSGPVEGILMICIFYCLIGLVGPGMLLTKICSFSIKSLSIDTTIDGKTIAIILGIFSMYFNINQAFQNVKKYYKHSNKVADYKAAANKAYEGLLPFLVYYLSVILLCVCYPEYLYDFGLTLSLSIGLSVAFSVGRIILAHLTLQDFPMIHFPMFMPTLQLIGTTVGIYIFQYDPYDVIYSLAWMGFGVTLGIHAIFINDIIYDITSYLDIYALSIKHKKKA